MTNKNEADAPPPQGPLTLAQRHAFDRLLEAKPGNPKPAVRAAAGYKGVVREVKKRGLIGWAVHLTDYRVKRNGSFPVIYCGMFQSCEHAAAAYDRFAVALYGPEAWTNQRLGLLPDPPQLFDKFDDYLAAKLRKPYLTLEEKAYKRRKGLARSARKRRQISKHALQPAPPPEVLAAMSNEQYYAWRRGSTGRTRDLARYDAFNAEAHAMRVLANAEFIAYRERTVEAAVRRVLGDAAADAHLASGKTFTEMQPLNTSAMRAAVEANLEARGLGRMKTARTMSMRRPKDVTVAMKAGRFKRVTVEVAWLGEKK